MDIDSLGGQIGGLNAPLRDTPAIPERQPPRTARVAAPPLAPPATLVASFASVTDAADAVVQMCRDARPSMVELMDNASINAVEDHRSMGLDRSVGALLIVQSDAAGQSGAGTAAGTSLLDPQAFLQLLVAQLQYQDPTNPVDTSSFMNQSAMLSQVQTMNSMSSTLAELVSAQQTQSATALIGKQITYTDASGNQQHGVVSSASMSGGKAQLHVGSDSVPLANVLDVTNPPSA